MGNGTYYNLAGGLHTCLNFLHLLHPCFCSQTILDSRLILPFPTQPRSLRLLPREARRGTVRSAVAMQMNSTRSGDWTHNPCIIVWTLI